MRLLASLVAAVALSVSTHAQQSLSFTIDQAQSNWSWSGQITTPQSLGSITLPIVGNPSNQTVNPFQLAGTIAVTVGGGVPITTATFSGGSASPVGGIHGKVNNPIPFSPPLGTFDIGLPAPGTVNAVSGLSSPASFVVAAGGAFSTNGQLDYAQGVLVIQVQGFTVNPYDFSNTSSSVTAMSGSLTMSASALSLNVSIPQSAAFRLTFQRDLSPGSVPPQVITGYIDFWGTLKADYVFPPVGTAFCSGDGSGSACPCANPGTAGRGCANSNSGSPGARLTALGVASIGGDMLTLTGTDVTGPGLFFQGSGQFVGGAGLAFGDGLICAGGTITRMGVVFPTGNSATYPGGLTPSPIHLAGGVGAPGVFHYQCWYRDSVSYCTAATYNLTQGLTVTWLP